LLEQKLSHLSKNGPESTPLPVLLSLEQKCPHLSENLFSLRRKATRLGENALESTLFYLRRARSSKLYFTQARLAE